MAVLSRVSIWLTNWSSRWVPSAFTIACILTLVTFVLGMTVGAASPLKVTIYWGRGFWSLLTFGMQMCLILFTGYIVAVSPPVKRLLNSLAKLPRSPSQAVVTMAAVSLVTCWLNWGVGLITSAVLVGYIARHQRGVDYRLLVATAYLGLGASWHTGLAGSVPLLLATPNNFLIKKGILTETIPLSETVGMPFSLLLTGSVAIVLCVLAVLLHPRRSEDRLEIAPEQAEKLIHAERVSRPEQPTPSERLEHSPVINIVIAFAGLSYLAWHFYYHRDNLGFSLNLNTTNFAFLFLGILLHWTPASFGRAAVEAAKPLHGIVLQFPLYAGIFGIIQSCLAKKIAQFFVDISTEATYPAIVCWYSAILNYFVPSGGAKWAIEAPYLIQAASDLNVDVTRVAVSYALGDMATNLIQPFWAIPLLAVAGLKFKDILGYEILFFLTYAVIVSAALLIVF